jgi:hypothetical protein
VTADLGLCVETVRVWRTAAAQMLALRAKIVLACAGGKDSERSPAEAGLRVVPGRGRD